MVTKTWTSFVFIFYLCIFIFFDIKICNNLTKNIDRKKRSIALSDSWSWTVILTLLISYAFTTFTCVAIASKDFWASHSRTTSRSWPGRHPKYVCPTHPAALARPCQTNVERPKLQEYVGGRASHRLQTCWKTCTTLLLQARHKGRWHRPSRLGDWSSWPQ